jgi:serine/threonine protein kinase
MDPERWQRVNEIFQSAVVRDESDRDAFLSAACGDDDALREEVLRLVRANAVAAGFLDVPAFAGDITRESPTAVVREFSTYRVGDEFRGTDRFTVRRRLGAGGMGVAYEVFDRERGETIALKTLLRTSAADILRLKREFRGLADIAHPNLVCLYELVVDIDTCFFTMELVDGMGIVDYVRASAPVRPVGGRDVAVHTVDPERVRDALRQLIAGVSALHRRGKLHRDIKPSNILVTSEGRLVLLDFGLISDVRPGPYAQHDRAAGTFDYLAPEQLDGAAPTEASDWYGVGVTLFEVLTGRAVPGFSC